MATNSTIEWTDATWNPIRGCSVVSPGCVNCYAMKQAHRFSGAGGAYEGLTKQTKAGPQWTGKIAVAVDHLLDPLSWRSPRRVFVNSMSDLFHEDVPTAIIDRVFAVMALAPRHTFQILTKRPARMRQYVAQVLDRKCVTRIAAAAERITPGGPHTSAWLREHAYQPWKDVAPPLPNVWLGVSVENQQLADERIPLLLQTPAAVRFISAEPLLGPLDLAGLRDGTLDALSGRDFESIGDIRDCGVLARTVDPPGLDWVIVGGESGPGARPMQLAWAESIIRQCRLARVPVFMKQLGSLWRGISFRVDDERNQRITHRKGGDINEWPVDLRVREFPRGVA